MDGRALLAIQELLNPSEQDESTCEVVCEDLDTPGATPYSTPAAIGGPSSEAKTVASAEGDIWTEEEVSAQPQYQYDDPRPQPEYEVVFRQNVGAEDVFLGMGGTTPATASCHYQIVRISLPDTQVQEVELHVTDTFLDCCTPNYRLGLYLPHKVEGGKSKAKWLSDTRVLEVTLRLNREYEYLNE